MDQNHPIPQEISSYQFRLVGDMTLKQFFQLASGIVIGLLIYATGLHPILKWPLALISVLLGIGLAFFPFEDRPLSQWIVGFFKSVYSPTEFYWTKLGKSFSFFQNETTLPIADNKVSVEKPPDEKQATANETVLPSFTDKLEDIEKGILERVSNIFSGVSSPHVTVIPAPSVVVAPTQQVPQVVVQNLTQPAPHPPAPVAQGFRPQIVVEESQTPQINKEPETPPAYSEVKIDPATQNVPFTTQGVAAQFSSEAAPPSLATIPNTITGQVLDENGKIVEGAVLEIKDTGGRPVRALKSNKLGHFIIVTSLPNGSYQISTEKEGLLFDIVSFEAVGQVIPPIAIRAKERVVQ